MWSTESQGVVARRERLRERRVGGLVRWRAREAEVEPEGRVEPLVRGVLGVAEVPHAVLVGVPVPVVDRGLRDDGAQSGHVGAAGGDHVGRRPVVGPADHRDPAVGPRQLRERVDEVHARLLLLGPAVVPAARRVARADHVGHRARVALGDERLTQRVVRELVPASAVGRASWLYGEYVRMIGTFLVSVRPGDLDVEGRPVDARGDRQVLVDDGAGGRREQHGGQRRAEQCLRDSRAHPAESLERARARKPALRSPS